MAEGPSEEAAHARADGRLLLARGPAGLWTRAVADPGRRGGSPGVLVLARGRLRWMRAGALAHDELPRSAALPAAAEAPDAGLDDGDVDGPRSGADRRVH